MCCIKQPKRQFSTLMDNKFFHSLKINQVKFLVYPVHLANTLSSHSEQQSHAAFRLDGGLTDYGVVKLSLV